MMCIIFVMCGNWKKVTTFSRLRAA